MHRAPEGVGEAHHEQVGGDIAQAAREATEQGRFANPEAEGAARIEGARSQAEDEGLKAPSCVMRA